MEAHIMPLEGSGYYLVRIFDRGEFGIEENRGVLLANRIQTYVYKGVYKLELFQADRFIGTVNAERTDELEGEIRRLNGQNTDGPGARGHIPLRTEEGNC